MFPRIDAMVAKLLDECIACCVSYDPKYCHPGNGPICVPISMFHCHQASIYLIVVLDEYSRFPEVEIVKSLSAQTLIPIFDKVFSSRSIPENLNTDNRTPFHAILARGQ